MRAFNALAFLGLFGLCLGASIESTEEKDINRELVDIFLYTRDSSEPEKIETEFLNLDDTHFEKSRQKTIVLIHGWNSGIDFSEAFEGEILKRVDANVFGVDWSKLESWTNYVKAAKTSIELGKYVGQFIARMVTLLQLDTDRVVIVGHSLGAQASGNAGRTVESYTGKKVSKISGLDPAKPWFDLTDPSTRINKNDAKFVEIVHTNSGELLNGCLSFPVQLGHIDFYPSGGAHQPGCSEVCAGDCTEIDLIDLLNGACSHGRANKIWIESINSDLGFTGTLCDSYEDYKAGKCSSNKQQKMGYDCESSPQEGKYFFDINKEAPFAQG